MITAELERHCAEHLRGHINASGMVKGVPWVVMLRAPGQAHILIAVPFTMKVHRASISEPGVYGATNIDSFAMNRAHPGTAILGSYVDTNIVTNLAAKAAMWAERASEDK